MESITKRLALVQNINKDNLIEAAHIPRSVKIELITSCNFKCTYCAINLRSENKPNMDWKLFVKIATELRQLGVKEIGPFMFGEPFVNPELLIKAVKFLKKDLEFPYVFLTTNGSLARSEAVGSLMEAGLDSIKWSLNAADWKQHKQLTSMEPKSFIATRRNLENAFIIRNEGNYKTKIYASSIRYDNEQEERMKEYLEKHINPFIDEFYWLPFYSSGGTISLISELGLKESTHIHKSIKGNTGRFAEPVNSIPCWTIFQGHILSDGIVTACCHDSTGRSAMGDLKTQTFMEVWHSDKFKELRRAHLSGDVHNTICEECIY